MATGLPAVATNSGSITEVIEDGREGVLVSGSDPIALADAIEGLLRDPDRRTRLGRAAADKARRCYEYDPAKPLSMTARGGCAT
jgi:D-inositol-3-phosphate glycosyltransferase